MNEANTTPTCCYTQEIAAPVEHSFNNIVETAAPVDQSLNNIVETATPVEHSFDNIAERCEELLPTPNLSLPADMELEVVDLSNNPNVP